MFAISVILTLHYFMCQRKLKRNYFLKVTNYHHISMNDRIKNILSWKGPEGSLK